MVVTHNKSDPIINRAGGEQTTYNGKTESLMKSQVQGKQDCFCFLSVFLLFWVSLAFWEEAGGGGGGGGLLAQCPSKPFFGHWYRLTNVIWR